MAVPPRPGDLPEAGPDWEGLRGLFTFYFSLDRRCDIQRKLGQMIDVVIQAFEEKWMKFARRLLISSS